MIKKTFEHYRGDPGTLTIYVAGDVSTEKISFVVKADKELTSDRLIEKKNTLAGGNNDEIVATKEGSKTRIDILLEKIDTQDFTQEVYYYDVTKQPVDSSTDQITIAAGEIKLDFDVQSAYDRTDLPADGQRYIPYSLSDLDNNDILQYDAVEGKPKGIQPGALIDANYYNKTEITNLLSPKITLTALSSTATGLTYTNTTGVFSLTSGYVIPTTTEQTNWGTAYTNTHTHSNKTTLDLISEAFTTGLKSTYDGYASTISGKIGLTALSSTATGLTYTNTTGVFSLTAGYVIPTTTEQTNWGTAYTNTHTHSNKTTLDLISEAFTTGLKSTYDGYASTISGKIGLTALSSTATGLTYTNTTGVFSLTAGYVIPTTTEQTNWGTAYTNTHTHSNKTTLDLISEAFTTGLKSTYDGYASTISGKIGLTALSSTATGLTYTNTTGVFSLTSGYVIPTTTQLSNFAQLSNWGERPSMYYNGINAYTSVSDNDNLDFGTGDFSISLRIKRPSVISSQIFIIDHAWSDANNAGYKIKINTSGELSIVLSDGVRDPLVSTGVFLTTNWETITCVRSGDNLYVYKNGVLATTTTGALSYNVSSNNTFRISANNPLDALANIQLENVRLFNLALSASEVTELYSNGLGAEVPYRYKWGGILSTNGNFSTGNSTGFTLSGSSTTTKDYTGNELTLTVTNGGSFTISPNVSLVVGNIYRLKYTIKDYAATQAINVRWSNFTFLDAGRSSNGSIDITFTATVAGMILIGTLNNLAINDIFTITDISLARIGCVADYNASNSSTTTLYDNSSNGLHGTHTNVSLSNPNPITFNSSNAILESGKLQIGSITDLGDYKLQITGNGIFTGKIKATLPTSSSGLSSGDWWNDNGTVKIIP